MADVKLLVLLHRRPYMSRAEFHDYWRHPHGTLGLKIATATGYVQSHQVDTGLLDDNQDTYDGIAELWLGNATDASGFQDEPTYAHYARQDEPNFIDMNRIKFLSAREEVITSAPTPISGSDATWSLHDRPTTIKLTQLVENTGDAPWEAERETELGKQTGALRHVLCHPHPDIYPDGAPFVGIRELYWPTKVEFERAVALGRDAFDELLGHTGRAIVMLTESERFK